jgi:EmrB/QacA subfamily drug resistance transporter
MKPEALLDVPIGGSAPVAPVTRGVSHWLVPAIIGFASFMQTLEGNVISNALPSMALAFHEDPIRLNVAITMFLLAMAVSLPLSGWIADKFGAKRVFTVSIALFALSSAACGLAHTLPELIVGRIFQGVAASMMAPVGRLVLLRTTPKHELIGAMAIMTMPTLLGPLIGPLLGGAIVTFADWRWIFYINLPVALICVVLVRAFIPNVKEQVVSPFDLLGLVLTGVGLAALIFGFESLGRNLISPLEVAGLFGLAAACFAGYWRHAHNNPHAILDLSVFRLQTFSASVVGGSFPRLTMGALPFLLAMLLQVGFGMSAFEAGTMTFIAAAGALLMRFTAPWILRRYGLRRVLIVNGLLVAVTFMAFALFRPDSPRWVIMVLLAVSGFFRALQFTSLQGLTYAEIDQDRMSRASTILAMSQQLAQSVGVGLAATFLHMLMVAKGETHLGPDVVQPAFFVGGGLTLLSMLWFFALPKTAGDQLHRRDPR